MPNCIQIPLISVIIPCYNQAQFLPDAVNCLIQQTYVNWECIIVNDGSTDNSAKVAEDFIQIDARIRVINQKNKGLSSARNTGLNNASGAYIQFLDADDKLERQKLETHCNYLQANPNIGIVFGDARYFTTQNPELRDFGLSLDYAWILRRWNATGTLTEKLLADNLFPVCCPLIRKSVFDIVGKWNVILEAHEDWEFWLRCAINHIEMAYIDCDDGLALIRMHPESMSTDRSRMFRTNLQMRSIIGKMLNDPKLRSLNFKHGTKTLKLAYPKQYNSELLKLMVSNFTVPVFFNAVGIFFILNNLIPNRIIKTYWRLIPWPIQKLFTKIFGAI